jgi:hypothetical protein
MGERTASFLGCAIALELLVRITVLIVGYVSDANGY